MNNFGALYRFEVKKILHRRLTVGVLIITVLLMVAMNIGEYIAGSRIVNKEEERLHGRQVDDRMLSEMRAAVEPQTATLEDGTQTIIGVSITDNAYQPLLEYLRTIGGNFDKACSMTEEHLHARFDGVVNECLRNQNLTETELQYWQEKWENTPMPLTYGKLQNGWGDSVCIIYVASILSMICIAASLSGVFSEETQLHTDALLYSSRNGKKRLAQIKLLAGVSVGMLETLIILLACIATEFAISGFAGGETSVQFFVGPTAMDMTICRAFWCYIGIMLVIGLLLSVFAMCLSQLLRNSVAVICVMMALWLLSMLNPPYSWRTVSQLCSYLPVTFLGSWTFSDYRTVELFGHIFPILQTAPVLYLILSAIFGWIAKISYGRSQVTK